MQVAYNPAAAPAAAPVLNVLKLMRPIQTRRGSESELVFKELTARQMRRYGMPMRIISEAGPPPRQEILIREDVCAKYIADLCDVDEPMLDQMNANDFFAACQKVCELYSGVGK